MIEDNGLLEQDKREVKQCQGRFGAILVKTRNQVNHTARKVAVNPDARDAKDTKKE